MALASCLAVGSCGPAGADPSWIGDDAAVIHCAVAGKTHALPPLVTELPLPSPPTGLYARRLDPSALDDLGYQRDSIVCATLEAPSEEQVTAVSPSIERLSSARALADERASAGTDCICEAVAELGLRDLLPTCASRPLRSECAASEQEREQAAELVAPLRDALAELELPLVHWRLVGVADRPDRFATRSGDLIALHPGGSEVHVKGAKVVRRGNSDLIEALLQRDDVVAVVRQDSGRALLVVRVLDGRQLVLDHFAYARLGPELQLWIGHLDNAQIERYQQALAPPARPRETMLPALAGTLFEFDRGALERVDRGLMEATALVGPRYSAEREQHVVAPALVDRLAIQVPFGSEGEVLRARLALTTAGETWLEAFGDGELFMGLAGARAQDVSPEFAAADDDPGFVFRGQPIEGTVFAGLNALPAVLDEVEQAEPGSVVGARASWRVELPAGPLPGGLATRSGLAPLRERLSKRRHRLTASLSADVLDLELRPR